MKHPSSLLQLLKWLRTSDISQYQFLSVFIIIHESPLSAHTMTELTEINTHAQSQQARGKNTFVLHNKALGTHEFVRIS